MAVIQPIIRRIDHVLPTCDSAGRATIDPVLKLLSITCFTLQVDQARAWPCPQKDLSVSAAVTG